MVVSRCHAAVAFAFLAWLCVPSIALAEARAPSRPVILIPGTLGTKLCTAEQPSKTVWPSDSRTGFPNLKSLRVDFMGDARSGLRPCGLLESFATFFQIWDVSVYRPLQDFLKEKLKYPENRVFVFLYDWRLSTFDNAERLARFVEDVKRQSRSAQVDILAHSMGGLITRIYLQKNQGGANVAHAIFLGVPHRQTVQPLKSGVSGWRSTGAISGSCSAAEREGVVDSISHGVGEFFGGIAGDIATHDAGSEPEIRASVFSWPSTYELLSLNDCCTLKNSRGALSSASLSTPEAWERLPWFPKLYRNVKGGKLTAEFRAYLAGNLRRSAELGALLRTPLPVGPKYSYIASQDHLTIGRVLLNTQSGAVVYKLACGDGTVTVSSAANGNIANARLVRAPHATIFNDSQARTYIAVGLGLSDLLDVATAGPPLAIGYYRACTGEALDDDISAQRVRRDALFFKRAANGDPVCLRSIAISTSPSVGKSADPIRVRVRFGGYKSLWQANLSPEIEVVDESGAVTITRQPISSALSSQDGGAFVDFTYDLSVARTGTFQVRVSADSLAEEKDKPIFATTLEISDD